jgi:hypothetical protein
MIDIGTMIVFPVLLLYENEILHAIEIEMTVKDPLVREAGPGHRDAPAGSWDLRVQWTLIDTCLEPQAGATVGQVSRDGAQLGGALEAETETAIEIGIVSADDLGIGMMTGLDAGVAAGAAEETEAEIRTGPGREVGAAARMTGENGARGGRGVEVEIEIGIETETGTERGIERGIEIGIGDTGVGLGAEARTEIGRGAAA